MIMRKYLVTIHEDGHISASEYEEPAGYTYSAGEGDAYRSGYNQALYDAESIIGEEMYRCLKQSKLRNSDSGWITSWAGRAVECELLKTRINKLSYMS